MAQRGRQIVEPQHLHQRADAAGREARLVAAASSYPKSPCSTNRGCGRPRAASPSLHALDVLGRELFLSTRAAESLHRRRHHRRGVVVRQRFDVRPLRHAQDKRGEHRSVDDVHFEAVALVKFRQLRDDLAIFLFGARRNVLRLLRGQSNSTVRCFSNDPANSAHMPAGFPRYFICSPFSSSMSQTRLHLTAALLWFIVYRGRERLSMRRKKQRFIRTAAFFSWFTCPDRRDTGTSRSERGCRKCWG